MKPIPEERRRASAFGMKKRWVSFWRKAHIVGEQSIGNEKSTLTQGIAHFCFASSLPHIRFILIMLTVASL
jgi:hypothetical protein